jgi:ferredoxin/coenzyme F420-reducing hydrogenase delta subunit
VLTFMLAALPWLPPFKRPPVAFVELASCNGCTRCAEDCPYNAISMLPRTDGRAFAREAVVDPSLCVSCGICAGACPTSMPFRRASALVPGIDLPDLTMAELRDRVHAAAAGLVGGPRIMVFGCHHGVDVPRLADGAIAGLGLPCIGMLPPAFVDYVLSRDLADVIFLPGCADGNCNSRYGVEWTEARLAGERDPHLRKRVPPERLARFWAARSQRPELEQALADFAAQLTDLDGPKIARHAPALVEGTSND